MGTRYEEFDEDKYKLEKWEAESEDEACEHCQKSFEECQCHWEYIF